MIEKFEIKLNLWKKKLNKKTVNVAVFMAFGTVLIFSMEMSNNFKRQKQEAQDSYNKSMYELVSYSKNVEMELAKLQLTSTPSLVNTTLASIWKQSNLAKENLESLPVTQTALQNSAKYLAQVSDYSYSLMKKNGADNKLEEKDYEQIKLVYDESKKLTSVLENIYDDLNNGRLKWDEIKKAGEEKLPDTDIATSVSNIEKIGKNFQEYEGLIYDGAFSDHLLSQEPKYLVGEDVSKKRAKEYVEELFEKDNIEKIDEKENSDGRIALYNFDVKLKNDDNIKNIFITKKDCKLYLMLSDKKVVNSNIQMDEAKKKGMEFLKKIGITNVEDTYYITSDNMATINYAAKQDNVLLYPDLIKVKIALDDGQICGVEAQGYIYNHAKRNNLKTGVTVEEAQSVINNKINVITKKLAVIPTENKTEILTYEFKGKIDEREFLIYVNAETKKEEKVLLILETPNGILTM